MPSAPSPTFSGFLDHRGVHVMSHEEVQWVINEYIESAVIAARTGLDSLELHSNHDDIIEWFLSPLTNTRTDEYGGSYENRRRFLREITDGIRARVDRPITLGLRLALDQDMDGGYGLDECMRFMQSFEADGTVDYFNLDIGGNWGAISLPAARHVPRGGLGADVRRGQGRHEPARPLRGPRRACGDGREGHRRRRCRHGGHGARPHRGPRVAPQDPRRPPRRGASVHRPQRLHPPLHARRAVVRLRRQPARRARVPPARGGSRPAGAAAGGRRRPGRDGARRERRRTRSRGRAVGGEAGARRTLRHRRSAARQSDVPRLDRLVGRTPAAAGRRHLPRPARRGACRARRRLRRRRVRRRARAAGARASPASTSRTSRGRTP